jgi:hypothetical protein
VLFRSVAGAANTVAQDVRGLNYVAYPTALSPERLSEAIETALESSRRKMRAAGELRKGVPPKLPLQGKEKNKVFFAKADLLMEMHRLRKERGMSTGTLPH